MELRGVFNESFKVAYRYRNIEYLLLLLLYNIQVYIRRNAFFVHFCIELGKTQYRQRFRQYWKVQLFCINAFLINIYSHNKLTKK